MPRLLPAVMLVALCASPTALAGSPIRSSGNLGLGLGGGYWLNGLSIKYFMADKTSLQGVIGTWGYGHNDGFYGSGSGIVGITGDFLWEQPAIADSEALELGWNAGLGPSLAGTDNYVYLAVHATLGLEFNFKPLPFDLVLEYKPGIEIVPDIDPDFYHFAGHVRIYPF